MPFCLQFCRYAGIRSANLGSARTRIVSIRLLSSFDDGGAPMEFSLIACSSTSCLIGFVKKAVHPAARHISRSLFKAEAVSAMIGVGGRSFACSHARIVRVAVKPSMTCLLYTSDAADDLLCVDLGCRRIIKKK